MRIDRVEAAAFGPFVDETLELAAGMTVVHGPNESGKSSWHAALYAGLCGMRRGRGAGLKTDRQFAGRHRPWDGDRWRVAVVVTLDDGRQVELSQDLAGHVDCRATDTVLGTDISDEVMVEGAPDGAAFLGLTRKALPATLCIRQADLLGVLDDAAELQEAVQRAAATEHLCTTGESAPLLLDDVTVQADGDRTQGILGLLHGISAERQIVLLSQEDDALDWAEQWLTAPQDALVLCKPVEVR